MSIILARGNENLWIFYRCKYWKDIPREVLNVSRETALLFHGYMFHVKHVARICYVM
jgi:hypothetical protein